jgi:hypothetical protein
VIEIDGLHGKKNPRENPHPPKAKADPSDRSRGRERVRDDTGEAPDVSLRFKKGAPPAQDRTARNSSFGEEEGDGARGAVGDDDVVSTASQKVSQEDAAFVRAS